MDSKKIDDWQLGVCSASPPTPQAMEHNSSLRTRYVYTQLAAALEKSQMTPLFGLELDLPREIQTNIPEIRVADRLDDYMLAPYITIMWVYYVHPQYFNRTSRAYLPLIQLARFIYHHAHRARVGDKQGPLEQFLWAFLAEFDAIVPSPAPDWSSQLDGVCLFDMLDVIREQIYCERYVYAWLSYHETTINLLTREFYEAIGCATGPLALPAHKAVYKKIAEHLQVARLPHVKLLIEAYLEKCVAAGAEDPEYITRRALYRMKITEAYDTCTEIGRAMRQHEFVTEHMRSSSDPPEEAPALAPGPAPVAPPRLERQRAVINEAPRQIARNLAGEFADTLPVDNTVAQTFPRRHMRVEIPRLDLRTLRDFDEIADLAELAELVELDEIAGTVG